MEEEEEDWQDIDRRREIEAAVERCKGKWLQTMWHAVMAVDGMRETWQHQD